MLVYRPLTPREILSTLLLIGYSPRMLLCDGREGCYDHTESDFDTSPAQQRHVSEVSRTFAPYADRTPANRCTTAKRRSSYTRSYFCLDNIDQIVVPTREEKEKLNAAGLGENRITFIGDEKCAEEFKRHILTAYPKLNGCGGFELLRLSGMTRSKKLSVLPCPSTGYTIRFIKDHIKNALIYIRPMQKNIDTTPVEPESVQSGPKEKCLICEEEFFFSELKEHVKNCRSEKEDSKASTSICPSDSQEFRHASDPVELDIDQTSTDAVVDPQIVDLTEDEIMQNWHSNVIFDKDHVETVKKRLLSEMQDVHLATSESATAQLESTSTSVLRKKQRLLEEKMEAQRQSNKERIKEMLKKMDEEMKLQKEEFHGEETEVESCSVRDGL
ncbi:hypothetical protein E1301_Tti019930 [Triplophysa tibetana]|uniref:Uncharacterized protein n=1 Tax=Triplophysa tibetana TaxID=1572043 RepID=A0A5A9PQ82_9TELE|nr:hypothetical protein E1301_Tti019930 [Triplophysa tibetana]